ncbi:acetoacetyl-CoA reductase (plasmid) [Legionella adelaidensis]|uniref:Acetoacetyl-CoA reductase n=1 Tax=Legionella adelaidensis TaxID=45056 RepID=A0A0W0R4Y5_9GAMM|nr:oxidoreductase [Legionella adelaidensis]KTC66082.1 acetyoacetyl CoA reductase [Legionella adelaidensis]VEH85700.1 acetoacetyl-CoA reductase [Legionella adelaidensis]
MLRNKKILVVGGGGLVGSNLVKFLLEHEAHVIAADKNLEHMLHCFKAIGIQIDTPQLSVSQLDLTNQEEVTSFFAELNGLTGAVNCSYPRNQAYGRHFFDVTLQDFNENVSLHLGSSFLFAQQCAKYFEKLKTPFSLVNIASIYGVVPPKFEIYKNTPLTMPVEYAAIKSAIIHLNQYIVKYIGNSNFRVNSISPGGIFDNQPEDFLNAYKNNTLGKGMLDPQDINGTILFLLSDYSTYINGQNIIVDDGFCLNFG